MAEHQESYIRGLHRGTDVESAAVGAWLLDSRRLQEMDEPASPERGDT